MANKFALAYIDVTTESRSAAIQSAQAPIEVEISTTKSAISALVSGHST